jgi:oligopeptide/dipeptide ABC transporter ATP-binding protein
MQLLPKRVAQIQQGEIMFQGRDLVRLSPAARNAIRGAPIAMVFQEPLTSLNPVMTVGDQISEVLRIHKHDTRQAAERKAAALLDRVGIASSAKRLHDYPYQLSGGMRQRVMIAMALACNPPLLIADEPTTALDVTIQAQILDLLRDLQKEYRLALLFITHDLSLLSEIANRIAVMYCGNIVESGDVDTLFRTPRHPYTRGLLNCVPTIPSSAAAGDRDLVTIPGTVPSLLNLPSGCIFRPRCPAATRRCEQEAPLLVHEEGREIACFNVGGVSGVQIAERRQQ